ncbi:MAG: EutN/CcmL family microcompartment protein [Candidatus Sericytochromatia bacterium]|nr:EutN/CcmL family microcompartment protein [Candidatus Sericytochromatia bacterium]
MMLARVTGTLVATQKHPAYHGQRIVQVQPLSPDLRPQGSPFYAVAHMQAGEGDLVLVAREGGSARMLLDLGELPIHAAIAGIVDAVNEEVGLK